MENDSSMYLYGKNSTMRKKNTPLLQTETYYHIYNRGINACTIFKEHRNYYHFFKLYAKYIPLIADTYAYCLIGNHFHFMIRIKSEAAIREAITNNNKPLSKILSHQFSKLFNSYAQAYNKACQRTGRLFEEPFRRIEIQDEKYFSSLIYYIHMNPKKHGVCNDYEYYPYSSYSSFLLQKKTQLKREQVLEWFGNRDKFIEFHQYGKYEPLIDTFDFS